MPQHQFTEPRDAITDLCDGMLRYIENERQIARERIALSEQFRRDWDAMIEGLGNV